MTLSLTGGTFVLLVRLFLSFAAWVPPAGLRKENGKMKINYTFANGETSDVEVSEEIGTVILDSRREESNLDRKERYHCYSLDAADFEGEDYADGNTPESELFLQLENQHIAETFDKLSEVQKRRLLTLVLYTNHLPKVGAMDSGIWRRLIVIPSSVTSRFWYTT